jgi:hypothetical protein
MERFTMLANMRKAFIVTQDIGSDRAKSYVRSNQNRKS